MKILHIAPEVLTVPAINGGAVEGIIERIVEHCKDSYAVSIHSKGQIKSDKYLYVHLPRIVNKLFSNRFFWNTIYYALPYNMLIVLKLKTSLHNFDILHVHNRPQLVPILKYFFSTKVVINHIHNEYLHTKTPRYLSSKNIRKIAKYSDAIITVSDFITKSFIKDFPAYQEKTYSLYNAIEVKNNSSKVESIRDRYNIKDESVILFTGRLVKEKGVHDCIDICIKLINDNFKIKLFILGGDFFKDGRDTNYIKELKLQAQNYKKSIFFTGFVDSEEASEFYKIASIFLFTPIWDDPSPLVIYEAMANSLPIVTTRSGGVPSILMDDDMVFDKGDLLGMSKMVISLINNRSYAVAKGQSNHDRFYKNFTYSHYCKKIDLIYKSCVDR